MDIGLVRTVHMIGVLKWRITVGSLATVAEGLALQRGGYCAKLRL